jgi:ketosteroid isomerase-like protein
MLPTEIVRGFYNALSRGDIPALLALLNDDLSLGPRPKASRIFQHLSNSAGSRQGMGGAAFVTRTTPMKTVST